MVGERHQHTTMDKSMLLLQSWCDSNPRLTPSIAKRNQFDSKRTDKLRPLEDSLYKTYLRIIHSHRLFDLHHTKGGWPSSSTRHNNRVLHISILRSGPSRESAIRCLSQPINQPTPRTPRIQPLPGSPRLHHIPLPPSLPHLKNPKPKEILEQVIERTRRIFAKVES